MGLTISILAGGASARMGRDKALLPMGADTTMLAAVAAAAAASGYPVLVVGRDKPTEWNQEGISFLRDEVPGEGPLGGLVGALGQGHGAVLLVACDMPLLTADAFPWLIAQWQERDGSPGVVTINGDQLEPLFAIYAQASLGPARGRLASGRKSLHGLIEDMAFARVSAPAWLRAQLRNVNTPEEYAELHGSTAWSGRESAMNGERSAP